MIATWLGYAAAAALAGAGAWLGYVALFHDRSRGRRRCPKCWYSMEGVPGTVCPECGKEAKREARLFKTRRRWGWVVPAAALCLAGGLALRVPVYLRSGWMAAVPATILIKVVSPSLGVESEAGGIVDEEIWRRFFDRELWQWQVQRYFAAEFRRSGRDMTRPLEVPSCWIRGEPMPVRPSSRIAGFRMSNWSAMEVQTAPGLWTSANGVDVPISKVGAVRIPFRLFFQDRLVYEGRAEVSTALVDSLEDLFALDASPERNAAVGALLKPGLVMSDGRWRARTFNYELDTYGVPLQLIVAYRADIIVAGRTVGRFKGIRAFTAQPWLKSTLREIEWLEGTPPAVDPQRVVFELTGDLTGAWEYWKEIALDEGQIQPRAWAGRIRVPASNEETP